MKKSNPKTPKKVKGGEKIFTNFSDYLKEIYPTKKLRDRADKRYLLTALAYEIKIAMETKLDMFASEKEYEYIAKKILRLLKGKVIFKPE